jgi:DNA topoisomerase-1
VQLGEATKTEKPKRAPLLKDMKPEDVTFKQALGMLQLPRDVGLHPKTKDMITSSVGRYGPYLKYQDRFISLKDQDVLKVTVEEAVEVIEQHDEGVKNGTIKSRPVFKKKGAGKSTEKGSGKAGPKKKAK